MNRKSDAIECFRCILRRMPVCEERRYRRKMICINCYIRLPREERDTNERKKKKKTMR
jgi:hypothetical protein